MGNSEGIGVIDGGGVQRVDGSGGAPEEGEFEFAFVVEGVLGDDAGGVKAGLLGSVSAKDTAIGLRGHAGGERVVGSLVETADALAAVDG